MKIQILQYIDANGQHHREMILSKSWNVSSELAIANEDEVRTGKYKPASEGINP